MPDPRIPTALHQLANLDHDELLPRWSWAIVGLERIGRIRLPAPAIAALDVGSGGEVRMRSNRLALVVGRDGTGAVATVDGRGRLYLPVWLRQAAADHSTVLVGTAIETRLVVVASVDVLDGIGDRLAGGGR
jgi:hypothetical protein